MKVLCMPVPSDAEPLHLLASNQIKPITRFYLNCTACGLPTIACLCPYVQPVQTRARFLVLTSERESCRASSTGRLLKLINPDTTELIRWERKKPSPLLLQQLQQQSDCYLAFPAETEAQRARMVTQVTSLAPVFILIDGTWKEARKIMHRSEYLQDLPLLSLEMDFVSTYLIRKAAGTGTLCTIEAAMELLKLTGEAAAEQQIRLIYERFLQHYQAGLNGHMPKV